MCASHTSVLTHQANAREAGKRRGMEAKWIQGVSCTLVKHKPETVCITPKAAHGGFVPLRSSKTSAHMWIPQTWKLIVVHSELFAFRRKRFGLPRAWPGWGSLLLCCTVSCETAFPRASGLAFIRRHCLKIRRKIQDGSWGGFVVYWTNN